MSRFGGDHPKTGRQSKLSGLRAGRLLQRGLGLRAWAQRQQVEEAAACARALTALFGRVPEVQVLPGGASRLPRALLTGRVLQDLSVCPWPYSMMRQLDPDDPAFLPPLGLHPVLAARDCTLVGLPDRGPPAWVDPVGWCGVGDGPAVTVWFGDARRLWTLGRQPGGSDPDDPQQPAVQQTRGPDGVGVLTTCRCGPLVAELLHFPIVIDARLAWALRVRLSSEGPAPRPVRVVFALRPAGLEGVAPIFHLARDDRGLWSADGVPILAMDRPGDEVLTSVHGEPEPWSRLNGQVVDGGKRRPGGVSRRCSVGLATGAEVVRTTIFPGQSITRLAIFSPPAATSAALAQTSSGSLWTSALADRRGLLRSGSELRLDRHDVVLQAARQRLLIDASSQSTGGLGTGSLELGGLLGAVALARLGFSRRAGDRLGTGLARVRRDGSLGGAEGPETAAVLAWAAAQHLLWTDAHTTARAVRLSWIRLVDRLVQTPPEPGGFALFGSRGSRRWSAIWRAAALVACASVLRDRSKVVRSDDVTRWGLAGAAACEQLDGWLGDGPWSSDSQRVPDGAAAAMLASVWLGVIPPDHRGVAPTIAALRKHHWHGGGVLLRGGAHVAATSLWVAAAERSQPGSDHLDLVGALASPTGALPTARHPARGAVGSGDDLLSSALFVLLAVERVQASRATLRILPGIVSARRLPTPFGPIDVEGDQVTGSWRGPVPKVICRPAALGVSRR